MKIITKEHVLGLRVVWAGSMLALALNKLDYTALSDRASVIIAGVGFLSLLVSFIFMKLLQLPRFNKK